MVKDSDKRMEQKDSPELTKEIIKRILENAIDVPLAYPDKTDDEVIYEL